MEITKIITAKIGLSPEEIAELWWGMDDEEQVRFFNRLGFLCEPHTLAKQLARVIDPPRTYERINLMPKGIQVMCRIGEYGQIAKQTFERDEHSYE